MNKMIDMLHGFIEHVNIFRIRFLGEKLGLFLKLYFKFLEFLKTYHLDYVRMLH